MRLSKLPGILVVILTARILGFCATPKTYPSNPVSILRIDTYTDAFATVYNSTYSIQVDTWDVLGSSSVYIPSNQAVSAFWSVLSGTTPVSQLQTWSIKDYTDLVYREGRLRGINEVLDDGVEEFMVWPDTSPSLGWRGWCSTIINGHVVATSCP